MEKPGASGDAVAAGGLRGARDCGQTTFCFEGTSVPAGHFGHERGFEQLPGEGPGSDPEEFCGFPSVPDNVQGPGCTTDPSEVTLPGCSCRSASCCSDTCPCLRTCGRAYDGAGALLALGAAGSGYCSPVFECNALCACSDACSSRVVQGGLRLRLEVYATENKGWGVRTLQAIPRGTFVCEYAGEVIGLEEARRRQLAQRPGDNNYIIAVREHAGEGSVTETFVDPAAVGNAGRFLNHSCRPNLFMQPVRVHSLVPRLALFAGRNVAAREELTFDYTGGYGNRLPAERLATPRDGGTDGLQRKECHCGANNCGRFLPLDLSIINAK
uniref:SET domain and mariner transposase fusion gene n=1 Tax=Gasterosteus aculeatus aculeatus TaxID=481459 RepID=A0AAQ4PZW5_GASAC